MTSRTTSCGYGSQVSASLGLGTQGRGYIQRGSQTHLGSDPLPNPYNLDNVLFDANASPLASTDFANDHDMHRDHAPLVGDDVAVAPQTHWGMNRLINPIHTTLFGDDLFHLVTGR